jgi:multimeric flavodoxin WrbA
VGKEKIRIVGLNGSPFGANCVTARILSRALAGAEDQGARIEMINLVNVPLGPFMGSRNGEICDGFRPLLGQVSDADGILIATPVWWGMPTNLIVNFLGHLTPTCDSAKYPLSGVPVGMIAVYDEDGAQSAIDSIAAALCKMGCVIPPFGMQWYNKRLAEHSERRWQETDVPILGRRIVAAAEIFKPYRQMNWDQMQVLSCAD